MKYLVFLLWIPAFFLLYLSIHHEILAEHNRTVHRNPDLSAQARWPH